MGEPGPSAGEVSAVEPAAGAPDDTQMVEMSFSEPSAPESSESRLSMVMERAREEAESAYHDTGVYGPPRDYGGPAAPSAPTPRRGVTGIIVVSLILTALSGIVALVVFSLSGKCDLEEAVGDFRHGCAFEDGADGLLGGH